MEGLANIKLGEDFGVSDTSKGLVNQWEWVLVFLRDTVELPVVYIEVQASIWLRYEEYRGGEGSIARHDKAFI